MPLTPHCQSQVAFRRVRSLRTAGPIHLRPLEVERLCNAASSGLQGQSELHDEASWVRCSCLVTRLYYGKQPLGTLGCVYLTSLPDRAGQVPPARPSGSGDRGLVQYLLCHLTGF